MSDMFNLSDEYEMSLDIDLENHLSFDNLDFWEEGDVHVSIMNICSLDGQVAERLLVVKNKENRYSVGQIIEYGEDDGGVSYDLRHVRLFMQEYGICSDAAVEDNNLMLGSACYIVALRIPRLIQATIFKDEELRQQISYDIEVSTGLLDREPPQMGKVIKVQFGHK